MQNETKIDWKWEFFYEMLSSNIHHMRETEISSIEALEIGS